MYFQSRSQAGRMLAGLMYEKYRYENCAVVALTDGGALVGEAIAAQLHCVLMMIVTEDIDVPGENMAFGAVSQGGKFTYNTSMSEGEIDEYSSEYHGYLDEQKRQAFQRINRLIGDGGTIEPSLLRDHVVVLVADGFVDTTGLDVAIDYLKPMRLSKLVIATPITSVGAVDNMHVRADDLYILDVRENFLDINHYYDENHIPPHNKIIDRISDIVMKWR